ncbi:MAG: zinc-binding dehydrogenase, partial [Chloroflexi bacterium]|nr:zinc-binding dehydrogenase [Chloroflexota bacterium]
SQVEAAELRADECVLVMGAAGALSTCIVQLAKEAGATVLAGAGSDARVSAAMSVGADHGINYRERDLVEAVLAATDGRGVDVVFENVGDPQLWPKAIESMAVGGRLLTIGTHAGDGILPVDVRRLYRNRLRIIGGLGSSAQADEFADAALRGVAEGRYRVLLDRVLPLSQAAEAFRLVASNAVTGKVVLEPTMG